LVELCQKDAPLSQFPQDIRLTPSIMMTPLSGAIKH